MGGIARGVLQGSRGKPVNEANLHITLVFLGSVPIETRRRLEDLVDRIQGAPFVLMLDRVGYWARPKVVWLGSGDIPPPLRALVEALNGAATACGLPPEARPYQPHLTLARKVPRRIQDSGVPAVRWPVRDFALVASRTLPSGAEYEVLRRWPLTASPPEQDHS